MTPEHYHDALLAKGMHPREAARAAIFAQEKGFDALQQDANGCVVFDVPSCGNLDCLNPAHQTFVTD